MQFGWEWKICKAFFFHVRGWRHACHYLLSSYDRENKKLSTYTFQFLNTSFIILARSCSAISIIEAVFGGWVSVWVLSNRRRDLLARNLLRICVNLAWGKKSKTDSMSLPSPKFNCGFVSRKSLSLGWKYSQSSSRMIPVYFTEAGWNILMGSSSVLCSLSSDDLFKSC